MELIVSIHDFCPAFQGELEEIVQELDKLNIKRSILVVPNYHDKFDIQHYNRFLELLFKEKNNEFCLHGYNHCKKGLFDREFRPISYQNARLKIHKGLESLAKFQIYPSGFVAPFWKICAEAEKAVADEGLLFSVTNPYIKDFRNNSSYSARPLWYWPYNKFFDFAFRLFNEISANKRDKLVRVGIHPQDIWNSKPFEHALKLIQELRKYRSFSSYKGFLDTNQDNS